MFTSPQSGVNHTSVKLILCLASSSLPLCLRSLALGLRESGASSPPFLLDEAGRQGGGFRRESFTAEKYFLRTVFQSLPFLGFHEYILCLQITSLAPLVFMGGERTCFVSKVILDDSLHLLLAPGMSAQPHIWAVLLPRLFARGEGTVACPSNQVGMAAGESSACRYRCCGFTGRWPAEAALPVLPRRVAKWLA